MYFVLGLTGRLVARRKRQTGNSGNTFDNSSLRKALTSLAPSSVHAYSDTFWHCSIETLRLPHEVMQRFYPAYRHYAEILQREALKIDFNLQPGELMLFDSTRVFHANKACLAVDTQHLQGAYSDLDGLYSCLRLLEQPA